MRAWMTGGMFVVLLAGAMGCRGPRAVVARDYGDLVSLRVTQPEVSDLGPDLRRMQQVVAATERAWPEGTPAVDVELRVMTAKPEASDETPLLWAGGQRRVRSPKCQPARGWFSP